MKLKSFGFVACCKDAVLMNQFQCLIKYHFTHTSVRKVSITLAPERTIYPNQFKSYRLKLFR